MCVYVCTHMWSVYTYFNQPGPSRKQYAHTQRVTEKSLKKEPSEESGGEGGGRGDRDGEYM